MNVNKKNGWIHIHDNNPIDYYEFIEGQLNIPNIHILINLKKHTLKLWQEIINAGADVTPIQIRRRNPSLYYTFCYTVNYKGEFITSSPQVITELAITLDIQSILNTQQGRNLHNTQQGRNLHSFDSAEDIFDQIGSPQRVKELQDEKDELLSLRNRK